MAYFPISLQPCVGIYDGSNNGKDHGYTLTTFVGYLLSEAEKLYGPRDSSWTFLGITFARSGPPQTWFPNTGRHVLIVLSHIASGNINAAKAELAHEVLHLLDPNRRGILLEEGLAVIFCEEMAARGEFSAPDPGRYTEARDSVKSLLTSFPDAIKKLRATDTNFFSHADPEKVIAALPGVDAALARKLCETLPRL